MTKHLSTLTFVLIVGLSSNALAQAPDKAAAAAANAKATAPATRTPLKMQIVISRFQGEKRVSSLPYSLSVNAGSRATLRMGAQVPVMMITAPASPIKGADGSPIPAVGPVQYRDIGTNIDCAVERPTDDGRFQVEITIDDASLYADGPAAANAAANNAAPSGNPSFRQFRASDSLMLKDGQTAQLTTATDKVSGEVVRVEVTLSVVK